MIDRAAHGVMLDYTAEMERTPDTLREFIENMPRFLEHLTRSRLAPYVDQEPGIQVIMDEGRDIASMPDLILRGALSAALMAAQAQEREAHCLVTSTLAVAVVARFGPRLLELEKKCKHYEEELVTLRAQAPVKIDS